MPFIVAAKEVAFETPPVAVAVAFAVPPSIALEVAVALADPLMPRNWPKENCPPLQKWRFWHARLAFGTA